MKRNLTAFIAATIMCATVLAMTDAADARMVYGGYRGVGYRGYGYRGLGVGYRG